MSPESDAGSCPAYPVDKMVGYTLQKLKKKP